MSRKMAANSSLMPPCLTSLWVGLACSLSVCFLYHYNTSKGKDAFNNNNNDKSGRELFSYQSIVPFIASFVYQKSELFFPGS